MIGNMTLEFPIMLEKTIKLYKQKTKKLKWNHRSQYLTDDYIYFKSIILRLFWKYLSKD